MLGRSLLLSVVCATSLAAQSPSLQVGGSIGVISQDAPTATESGFQVGLIAIKWIQPWLGFGSTLEFARTSVGSRVSICGIYDATNACFHRPDAESVVSAGGRLQLRIPGERGIRPRGSFGLAWNQSLSDANPGERRAFVTPEFEAGVEWGHRPKGLVAVRVRNLDRWTGTTHGQAALLVGLLW